MSPRLAGLDGLRGLAALCVLAFHAWLYRDGTPARVAKGDPADVALSSLRTALVLFFVLSGFLLARDLRRWLEDGVRPTLRDYATRRAMRILPAYWVAIVGSVALLWGGRPADGIRLPPADDLWVFAILGQNYFSDTVMKLNPVTWTLCVEVAFYALLPLLAVGLRALGRRGLPLAALLLVAGSLAANAAAHEHAWNLAERKSPLPYLGYFGIGIGVAWVAGRRRAALGSWPTAGLALGGVAAATGWVWWASTVVRPATDPVIGLLQHLPVAAGFGLLIWAAAAGTGPVLRVLGWRPFTGLGVVSYGVFLWHLPIMLAVNRITHLPGPVLALVTLVLTVPVAIVSWRALERPAPAQRAGRAGNTVRERTPSLA